MTVCPESKSNSDGFGTLFDRLGGVASSVVIGVESGCDAVAVGPTYLFPPLSPGGALVVRPWLRFHIPLIEPDMQIARIRLSDKTFTPSPTARRVQADTGVRAQSARKGAREDRSRPCFA